MICRVHYVSPEGRAAHKDVTATKEDARAVFGHLYPGVTKIMGVEVIGSKLPRRKATSPSAPAVCESPMDGRVVSASLRQFREQLAAKPTPRPKRWRVGQRVGQGRWQIKRAPGWNVVHQCDDLVQAVDWFRAGGVSLDDVHVLTAGDWRTLAEHLTNI